MSWRHIIVVSNPSLLRSIPVCRCTSSLRRWPSWRWCNRPGSELAPSAPLSFGHCSPRLYSWNHDAKSAGLKGSSDFVAISLKIFNSGISLEEQLDVSALFCILNQPVLILVVLAMGASESGCLVDFQRFEIGYYLLGVLKKIIFVSSNPNHCCKCLTTCV